VVFIATTPSLTAGDGLETGIRAIPTAADTDIIDPRRAGIGLRPSDMATRAFAGGGRRGAPSVRRWRLPGAVCHPAKSDVAGTDCDEPVSVAIGG